MVGKRALEKEFTGLKKVDLCVNQRRKEQDRRKGGGNANVLEADRPEPHEDSRDSVKKYINSL